MQYVTSNKVCEHFLQAVEKRVYGWMWVCPNGYQCQFRHCLPEGYVFKQEQQEVKKPIDDEDSKLVEKIDS